MAIDLNKMWLVKKNVQLNEWIAGKILGKEHAAFVRKQVIIDQLSLARTMINYGIERNIKLTETSPMGSTYHVNNTIKILNATIDVIEHRARIYRRTFQASTIITTTINVQIFTHSLGHGVKYIVELLMK